MVQITVKKKTIVIEIDPQPWKSRAITQTNRHIIKIRGIMKPNNTEVDKIGEIL